MYLFQNTLDLVPGFLQQKLGREMNKEAMSGWGKVLEAIKATVQAKLQELEAQQSSAGSTDNTWDTSWAKDVTCLMLKLCVKMKLVPGDCFKFSFKYKQNKFL